ncbi:MAG: hypothetical protein HUJ56_12000 [Erysipelotrichaceae bacterium]|nr:hypothetical protein [Erysipelotrichaceae bacterium]
MFDGLFNEYVNKVKDSLLACEDKEIKKIVKKMLKNYMEDEKDKVLSSLALFVALELLPSECDEEEMRELIKKFAKVVDDSQKSIQVVVTVDDLPGLSRCLSLPYTLQLNELVRYVLASLNAYGGHLFSVYCKNKTYKYNGGGYDNPPLSELKLKEGNTLTILYDYGESYYINVKVEGIVDEGCNYGLMDAEVLGGEGFGIIEDNHYLTDLYYNEYDKFITAASESDFYYEDLPEFDINTATEMLLEGFLQLTMAYEDEFGPMPFGDDEGFGF